MQNEQVQEITVSVEDVKEKISLLDDLESLKRSPAFKRLILKQYIQEKPHQLVKLMALPQTDTQKEVVHGSMVGISALQLFFNSVQRDGDQARADLAAYEAELEAEMSNA